jgi:hypothetical protein
VIKGTSAPEEEEEEEEEEENKKNLSEDTGRCVGRGVTEPTGDISSMEIIIQVV